ncbi:hypothetical protein ACQPYK_23795 [Streptosporangium sp. CA-135522]|uniref:hypothetical protein n=1 Tax=Streptosporangium sp. CA-135522 TaxID=3240072 RepID=UPI003D935CC8
MTSEKVDHLLTGPMQADLDRLLMFDEELGMTRLAWLTRPAVEATATTVKGAIDKLRYLRGMDAHRLDLSMLPTERRRFLATLDGGCGDPEGAEPGRRPEGPGWGADVVRCGSVRRLPGQGPQNR